MADPSTENLAATPPLEGAPAAQVLLEPGTCVGRYVLLELVGPSGMGVVYKAYDPELSRSVALKLLPTGDVGAAFGQRLLREAQALARLSSPHVVAVHDAGTFGANVFVAMEFIEGETLRRWLTSQARTIREIRDVFAEAGEGLGAAHRAGIVHRDFKPDNVIVGTDGRVRVFDFGLAHTAGGASTEASVEEGLPVLGTPQYMAPEQHDGGPIDARTDQFGLSVALYEALYGETPFAGSDLAALRENVAAGRILEPPAGSPVPKTLRRIVLQGLAPAPADRHPSMTELVLALREDPEAVSRRRRREAAGFVAFLLLLVGAIVLVRRGQPREPVCGGAERKLVGIWDDDRRTAVANALTSSGKSYAPGVVAAVSGALDRYATAWVAMHEDACKATRVRGEQSEDLLDRRMTCLADRLVELGTLTEVFVANREGTLERAAQSAQSLPGLEPCADVAALRAPVPPPADAETRRHDAAIRERLARANALEIAGQYEEGETVALAAVAEAAPLAYRPIQALAHLKLGQIQSARTKWADAARSLHLAYAAALAGHHDEAAISSATSFMAVLGQLSHFDDAESWSDIALATAGRLGSRDDLLGTFLASRSRVRGLAGKYDLALADARRALEIQAHAWGPAHHRVSLAYNLLGQVQYDMGHYEDALVSFHRGLEIDEKNLGADHPHLTAIRANMANVHGDMGHHEQALAEYEKCLVLYQRRDPSHTDIAAIYNNMGEELRELGRLAQAKDAFQHAYDIWSTKIGPSRFTVTALLNLGKIETELAHYDDAFAYLKRSLAMADEILGPDHPRRGDILTAMGEVHLRTNEPRQALVSFEAAILSLEKGLGRDHPRVPDALLGAGAAHNALHEDAPAVPVLERGIAILAKTPNDGRQLAALRFELAKALFGLGQKDRALAAAASARDGFAAAGALERRQLAAVSTWLATHP